MTEKTNCKNCHKDRDECTCDKPEKVDEKTNFNDMTNYEKAMASLPPIYSTKEFTPEFTLACAQLAVADELRLLRGLLYDMAGGYAKDDKFVVDSLKVRNG